MLGNVVVDFLFLIGIFALHELLENGVNDEYLFVVFVFLLNLAGEYQTEDRLAAARSVSDVGNGSSRCDRRETAIIDAIFLDIGLELPNINSRNFLMLSPMLSMQ